jgi:hypothetical protein
MSDSVPLAESESISVVRSGWLRAARCFAFLCILIGVVGVVHAPTQGLQYSVSLIPYLAALSFLFLGGKNPLAFALGIATATGFLGGGLTALGAAAPLPFAALWIWVLLSEFSTWLLWLFVISSMMLGLSAYLAFDKTRFEAKGRRWIAFGGGVFTAVLVLVLSSLADMLLGLRAF